MTGFVKIHTHFYENGNVQMKNDKNMTALSLDMTSEDFVRSLFDSIKEFESQLQVWRLSFCSFLEQSWWHVRLYEDRRR